MPSITLTLTQAQVDRVLAALPPEYSADAAGAKQLLIDVLKERVRAKETVVPSPIEPAELEVS